MKIDLIELTSKIADKMLEEESSTEFKKRIIKEICPDIVLCYFILRNYNHF